MSTIGHNQHHGDSHSRLALIRITPLESRRNPWYVDVFMLQLVVVLVVVVVVVVVVDGVIAVDRIFAGGAAGALYC